MNHIETAWTAGIGSHWKYATQMKFLEVKHRHRFTIGRKHKLLCCLSTHHSLVFEITNLYCIILFELRNSPLQQKSSTTQRVIMDWISQGDFCYLCFIRKIMQLHWKNSKTIYFIIHRRYTDTCLKVEKTFCVAIEIRIWLKK